MQVTRRGPGGAILIALLATLAPLGWSQAQQVDPEEVQSLLATLDAVDSTEPVRIIQNEEGFVRFVQAPRGASFTTPTSSASGIASRAPGTGLSSKYSPSPAAVATAGR